MFSTLIEIRSESRSSPRGSMPRARSRSTAADAAGQQPPQLVVVERGETADRLDAGCEQPLLRLRADAGEPAHVEAGEERRLLPGNHDDEAARLARVASDLRDDLARRDSERAREARTGAHRRLHGLGDDARLEEVARDLAEVEVSLVDPGLLDGRDDPAHRRPDVPRVLAVERVARPDEDRVRAAADRLGRAHRRMDPEPPRDVVRGRDDAAPLRVAADDERLLAQLGVLELLDGRVERVEIEVRDDAGNRHANKRTDRGRRYREPPPRRAGSATARSTRRRCGSASGKSAAGSRARPFEPGPAKPCRREDRRHRAQELAPARRELRIGRGARK